MVEARLERSPLRAVYCPCKRALERMTRAIAAKLGPHSIRVNTICPIFFETPSDASLPSAAFRADVLSKMKLGRLGQVANVMAAVVFLASDASR